MARTSTLCHPNKVSSLWVIWPDRICASKQPVAQIVKDLIFAVILPNIPVSWTTCLVFCITTAKYQALRPASWSRLPPPRVSLSQQYPQGVSRTIPLWSNPWNDFRYWRGNAVTLTNYYHLYPTITWHTHQPQCHKAHHDMWRSSSSNRLQTTMRRCKSHQTNFGNGPMQSPIVSRRASWQSAAAKRPERYSLDTTSPIKTKTKSNEKREG